MFKFNYKQAFDGDNQFQMTYFLLILCITLSLLRQTFEITFGINQVLFCTLMNLQTLVVSERCLNMYCSFI